MKIKNSKHNYIKFKHNYILLSSITSCIVIFSSTSAQAMFKTSKNLSGNYGGNVRRLIKFFESAGTSTPSTNLPKTSSIPKTDSKIKTQTSSLTKPSTNGKTYVSKLSIQISGKSSTSNLTKNNQNNNSTIIKNTKSPIKTAKSDDIFGIYTSGSTNFLKNDKIANSADKFKSIYSSITDTTSSKSNSKNNTSSSGTSFKLDLKVGGNPKLKPLTYSKKRLEDLESQIKVFTASVIKTNLPKGSSGKVELKFDKKLGQELNLVLSKFVYKSAMDSINGYLNDNNN